jgi:hypothetical protein
VHPYLKRSFLNPILPTFFVAGSSRYRRLCYRNYLPFFVCVYSGSTVRILSVRIVPVFCRLELVGIFSSWAAIHSKWIFGSIMTGCRYRYKLTTEILSSVISAVYESNLSTAYNTVNHQEQLNSHTEN